MSQMFVGSSSFTSGRSGLASCQFQAETEKDLIRAADQLMAAHQFAAASRRYTAAIGLNPRNASYQLGIAFCNWHLGNDNDTVRHLHEAIRLDPNLALAHSTLAMWYVIHGLSEAAERSSATAYKLAPQDIEVLTARANVLDQAGDSEAACQILARAQGVTNQRLALPY